MTSSATLTPPAVSGRYSSVWVQDSRLTGRWVGRTERLDADIIVQAGGGEGFIIDDYGGVTSVTDQRCYLLSAGRRFFFSADSPRLSLLYCQIANGQSSVPRACVAHPRVQTHLLAATARARAASLSVAAGTAPDVLAILENAISEGFAPVTGVRCDETFQQLLAKAHGGDFDHPGPEGLLADMSRECGLSERTIQIRFRRLLSTSPLEYVRNARLDRALRILSQPDGPSKYAEVAAELGFTNLSRFTTSYERRHGQRPVDTIRNRRPARSA